ncbi:19049_t:CDS:10 [Funneliformis geosporum]|nr:19049_t:CDS:10 [Funneliformis geosporum]
MSTFFSRSSTYDPRKSCDRTSTSLSEDTKPSSSSLPTRQPRTSVSTRAGRDNNSLMVAIIEGRGVASEIGMCFINLRTTECILSQIADSQTYIKTLHKLNLFDPTEIVLSQTAFEPSKSKLCKVLEDNVPMASIVSIGRKYFNDAIGLNYIKQDTFFAIQTALRPFQDIDHLITALIQVPKKPSIKYAEQSINNVILLKYTLRSIQLLKESFTGIQNSLLDAICALLTDSRLDAFEERINEVINEDVTYVKSPLALRNQRCYAVKAGFNGLLDVARQTYKEVVDDLKVLINSYCEQYQMSIKTQFSSATGFYLSINIDQLEDRQLPLIFINTKKKRKSLTFTTLAIVKINTKINDSLTEVYLMSDKTIEDLISEIRGGIGVLYKASESIAMLDMLISFVHQCTVSNYVRPEFTDTLAIKAGRHPMRESLDNDTFVPNDTYASNATSFQLITGPNMSGKSTYLRQIALMSIIVPAEYASFRVVDQLFTRICNDENIENNASTFVIEMRETAYILQNVTDDSLVIIDELGRGTSTHDGLGITYAICEELLKTKAFIFFATHFHELTRSLTVYPKVVNLHLEVEINEEENRLLAMKYLYRVKDGINDDEHYGLKFGQIVGLPQKVITKASEVSHKLKDLIDTNKEKSTSNKIIQRRKILLQLTQYLLQIKCSSNLDQDSLRKYLKMVQEEFIAKMEELV